jgi:hypothetical protein
MEPMGRGVLDTPPARGMTTLCGVAISEQSEAIHSSANAEA